MGNKSFDEDMVFEDTENYRGSKDSYGIKEITLKHFDKCCTENSKPMTYGGYVEKKIGNRTVNILEPSQISIFINCVLTLETIMLPKIKKEDKYKENITKIEDQITKIDQDMNNEIRNLNQKLKSKDKSKKDNHGMDYMDYVVVIKRKREDLRLISYRMLLDELSQILYDLNYYEEQGMTF